MQKLLNKIGIAKSYIMLNTFLFGINGQMDAQMNAIAVGAPILSYRNGLFDDVLSENAIQAIISFGNGADLAINSLSTAKKNFDGLSYSKKKGFIQAIEGAKTEETRDRRIEKAINELK